MFFKMFDDDIINIEFIKFITAIKAIKKYNSIKYRFEILYKDKSKYGYSIEISLDNIIKSIDHVEFSQEFVKFKENYSQLVKRLLNE